MIGEDPLDLGGQVALVTGAGQSAGRGIALALAKHNAGGVVVNDFVADRAEAVAAEIRALGVRAVAAQCDVGDYAAVKAAFDKATAELGPITILVNNAGNAGPNQQIQLGPWFWEADPAEWDRYMRTNLYGVMNCCHVALPGMVAQKKGRIVTIISDAGRVGDAKLAAYAAAKAGAAGLVRSLAREGGRFGVTSNAISLSTLEPPASDEKLEEFRASENYKTMASRYVVRRLGRPADVANLTLFLCSDAAEWITGQTSPLNGGSSFAI